jgi:hypothetical protein
MAGKRRGKIIHVNRAAGKKRYAWENNQTMENVVRNLASAGLPNKEIANLIGVRLATLERRVRTIPELEEALVEGRSHATQVMVAEMFKTALGGHVTQEITETVSPTGKKSTKVVTREAPPNPHLMIYWLNNRDPENWKSQRQLMKESRGEVNDGKTAESDKIARLSREVFESHPTGTPGEYTVSETASHATRKRALDEGDLCADVPGETADNLQDDVLDVSAEEGTEPL